MERIIKARLPLRREEVSREEARKRIEAINEPYKLEILDSIKVGSLFSNIWVGWMDGCECHVVCTWIDPFVHPSKSQRHPIPTPPDGAHHDLPHRGGVVGPVRGAARGEHGGPAGHGHQA